MRSLQATVCFLLAAALTSSSVIKEGWRSGQEYRYSYNTQVLSGIPQLKNQYAGMRLTAEVRVQPESDNVLKIKIEEPRYQTYNEELELIHGKEAPRSGEENIDQTTKTWLEKPFKVHFRNGVVENVDFEQNEPQYVINIKKGLISQMQIDMVNMKSADSQNQIQRQGDIVPEFKTTESSILGECETTYSIVKLPHYRKLEFESNEVLKSKGVSDSESSISQDQVQNQSSADQDAQQDSFEIVDEENEVSSHQDVQERRRAQQQKQEQKKQQWTQYKEQQKRTQLENQRQRESRKQQQSQAQLHDPQAACADKEYYEVIKTRNMQKCKSRPLYEESFGAHKKAQQSQSSSLPTHSSVTRAIVCGTPQNFVVRKVITENRVILNAMGQFASQEKLDVSSFSVLKLQGVQPQQSPIEGPSSPKTSKSLVYEYPAMTMQSAKSLKEELLSGQSQSRSKSNLAYLHAPMPDMQSAPASMLPWPVDQQQIKQQIIENFNQVVQASQNTRESSTKEKDVAGMAITISEALAKLSLHDLQEIEQQMKSQHGGSSTSPVMKIFYDLVSMAGTNPAAKLIIEKTKSGEMRESSFEWSWILSNTIRSVRTPTEELLKEFVQLLKNNNVEENRLLRASVAMTLSELLNRACVNQARAEKEFPTMIYGRFCDKDSEVIKRELLPYLSSKLQQHSSSDMGSLIADINAIGNLGTEESTELLLKVIEGRRSHNAHPRSLAVYKLIKAARSNPIQIRPVFQSLIENPAENEEVRVAAVTGLVNTYPSTADLQRLAVRTWYENSEQVASYIHFTLNRLSNLTDSNVNNYRDIKEKARQAITLARPSQGIQLSKNLQNTVQFGRMNVNAHQRYHEVNSKDSALPKSLYYEGNIIGESSLTDPIEHALYLQGGREILTQLYDLYYEYSQDAQAQDAQEVSQNKRQLMDIIQKMRVDTQADQNKPEGHYRINYMGLQQLFSFDSTFVRELTEKVREEIRKYRDQLPQGINWEHRKFVEFFGFRMVFPTEAGVPGYVVIRNPANDFTTVTVKAQDSQNIWQNIEVKIKHIANYKNKIQVGVACPISKKILAAGVESSVNWGIPLNTQVSLNDGQLQVKVMQPQNSQSGQSGFPLFQYDVKPFTVRREIATLKPASQSQQAKEIRSNRYPQQKAYKFGRKTFGLDMTAEVDSDRILDLVQLTRDARYFLPLFLTSPPFDKISPRKSSVSIWLNPQNSETKEVDLVFSLASGSLKNTGSSSSSLQFEDRLQMQQNQFKIETELNRIAQQHAQSADQQSSIKQKAQSKAQQSPSQEIVEECRKQKEQFAQNLHQILKLQDHQSEQIQKMSEDVKQVKSDLTQDQVQTLAQEAFEKCQQERKICEAEQEICQEVGRKHQQECQQMKNNCKLRQKASLLVKQTLKSLKSGQSVSGSIKAYFKGQSQDQERRYEVDVTYGQQQKQNDFELLRLQMAYKLNRPLTNHERHQGSVNGNRKSYEIDVVAEGKVVRPSSTWDSQAILNEKFSTQIQASAQYKSEQGEQKEIKAVAALVQSEQQKQYARSSPEARQCQQDEQQGYRLSRNCKQARHQASSLDKLNIQFQVPTELARDPKTQMIADAVRGYFWPYIQEVEAGNSARGSGSQQEIEIEAQVSSLGHLLDLEFTQKSTGYKVQAKKLRLGKALSYALPICAKENIATTIRQKLTGFQAPSSCVIEGSQVTTFDGLKYHYKAHECEQVLLSERSQKPRVMVTLKNSQAQQIASAVFDGQRFDIELRKQSRHSRNQDAQIKVNGQQVSLQQGEVKRFNQGGETVITKYQDGVYVIHNQKYGVTLKLDGQTVEVKAKATQLKNRAMGVCGDLNGEQTADMKSTKQCIMSKPQLAAYSYTVDVDNCQAIPSADKQKMRQEEQQCEKETEIPTKVSSIFEQYKNPIWQPSLKHLVERHQDSNCISKDLVRTCGVSSASSAYDSTSRGNDMKKRTVYFVCYPKQESQVLVKRAQGGDVLSQLQNEPVSFSKTIFEPTNC